jgi:RHS repeat-associated protein
LNSCTYEPFGSILSQTGSGSDFNYTGKEFDEGYNFNLYYYSARYYNAELGRFISPDPVREYLNPYSYVGNEPVMRIDPDGKWWFEWVAEIAVETYDTFIGVDEADDEFEDQYLNHIYGRDQNIITSGPESSDPDMSTVPSFPNSPQPDATGYGGGH